MIVLRVLQSGLQTTVQDLGRLGCRRWGIAPSGAADPFSARLANLRVGNPSGAALLEMTASGAAFESLAPVRLAVAGAEMPALRNGDRIETESCFELAAGDSLELGAAGAGFRTYLAVAGGIDVPTILGSRSTHLSAGFGGWQGRKLERGDQISALEGGGPARRGVASSSRPESPVELRTIAGPQRKTFSADTIRRFFETEFRVSARSNRMGIRLEGDGLRADEAPEMAPEGSVPGAIQIPPGGEPIVHMPEGPVTGGYSRIAAVISADLGALGQLRPGEQVRFRDVTLAEALQARRDREMIFEDPPR